MRSQGDARSLLGDLLAQTRIGKPDVPKSQRKYNVALRVLNVCPAGSFSTTANLALFRLMVFARHPIDCYLKEGGPAAER